MPASSKVIVLDPDARAGRQIQLGFQREGVAAEVASSGDLPTAGTGLVIVGGSDGQAVELVRKARAKLQSDHVDAPIVFAGRNGVPRKELEDAGADEVLAQPAYLRDVVTIGRLLVGQPAAHRSHLVGSLAELTGVLTLVRALSTLGRSATLTLVRGLRRGEVRFFEGEVTSAQVGLIHGQAALHQLLLWTDARFEFHHEDIVRRQQIPMGREELFSDAERFLAGIRESAGSLSPSLVLEQDGQRVQQLAGQIPTEVHGVLRMFDGHRVLADVLEDSPYRVFETLRVAQRALDAGLLRKAQAPRPKATWRAVLAIEEWLVGHETRDDVVARGATENTGPLARPDETKPKKKSSSARQRKKRRASARIIPTEAAKALEPPTIDWGALVPRSLGAEVGPISGVVPAAQRSGEILLPTATRDEPREKLESLDTQARERIFPTEVTAEPSIVVGGDDAGERAKQEAERAAAALAIAREASEKAKLEAARTKKPTDSKDLVKSLLEEERVTTPSVIVTETPTATVTVHDRLSVTRTEQTARLVATPEATVSDVPFLAVPVAQQPAKADEEDDSATRPFLKAEPEAEAAPAVAVARPKIEVNLDADRPPAATGEIRSLDKPVEAPPASRSEPSILVTDLQAAASAAMSAPPQKAPDAATKKAVDEVVQVRRDATGAFSNIEEEFFKAGAAHEEGHAPLRSASESFDDLDEGYQKVGFWDRLLGRKPKR
jgi:hypothetical protein